MRYQPKLRHYTAFTRGVENELIKIPLKAYNDADAVGRAVYQCEGRRQAVAAVRDVSRTMAYILAEIVCDDDNGREVWVNPLLCRRAQDPLEIYLSDRERGWV